MSQHPATQRDTEWADARDRESTFDDDCGDLSVHQGVLLEIADHEHEPVRSAMLQTPNEVGTWSLEYLGPGFHVQLRIARRNRQARVDGWMSPAQPIKVFLSTLLHKPTILEAQVNDSGRFEFPIAPSGACRMSFATQDHGRHPATPPFWI